MNNLEKKKEITPYLVFSEDSILNALAKITSNKSGVVFVVTESGILQGLLTDGDFRRWISSQSDVNLELPVSQAMNNIFRSQDVATKNSELIAFFDQNPEIRVIPLVDSQFRLSSIVFRSSSDHTKIGERYIGLSEPAFIIAEIGNNHNGSIVNARALIDAACEAGADCVKFQMRDLSSLYVNKGDSSDISADLGAQYTLDLLQKYQLEDNSLFHCFDYALSKNIIPLCTPWDLESLHKLESWGMQAYKIASADFTNYQLLTQASLYNKPLVCSTGMSTESEIISGIKHLELLNTNYILLHCNSTYPTPFKDVNLKYIKHLADLSGRPVGYSGHERGYEIPLAAVAMGAVIIEKHITLDRGMEGNDHKVSLLPNEFKTMCVGIRNIEEALGTSNSRTLSQGEAMNREILSKSLVTSCTIKAGSKLSRNMVEVRSPGKGIQPNRLDEFLGKTIRVNKKKGDFYYPSDFSTPSAQPRNYNFSNPFGAPVRYHDLFTFCTKSNFDLLEIHLSFKDLEVDIDKYFDELIDASLVVHAPELFEGDHTLDLCSVDPVYRKKSLENLSRVIELTDKLRHKFSRKDKVTNIVTNVGGFSANKHLEETDKSILTENLIISLQSLDIPHGVSIIPQTMPPFPWHFGGQRYHNLFVDPEFIRDFCSKTSYKVCLDASHSKLACNHLKIPFRSFLQIVLPYTVHLHLADAIDLDGEGIQIEQGQVDWDEFYALLAKLAPDASFIPEIWQGHKNDAEDMWLALERLEKYSLKYTK